MTQFYMAWNKNEDILKDSTSGGAFSALAEYVFSNNGVVFGATLNSETKLVEHIKVDNIHDLSKIRWSKYNQSEVHNSYLEIKTLLDEGRLVLFSGTPCQIAALCAVCGHPQNLITADVLCHGVTSKYIVDEYIKSQEKKFKKKIKSYYFRVKDDTIGWKNGGSRVKLIFCDGTTRICDSTIDAFYVAYNKNLVLRESCYRCNFCGTDRISDFTLADFWGIDEQKVSPNELKNGVSLLLVNTNKGHKILDNLGEYLVYSSINPDEALPYNRALVKPGTRPMSRTKLFSRLRKGRDYRISIESIYARYYLKNWTKSIMKGILGEKYYKKIVTLFKKTISKNVDS